MTPSMSSRRATVSSISAAYGSWVTVSPSAATITSCALVPLACGKLRSSSWMPSCASVPGIEKELSVPFMKASAPPPAMPSRSTQATSTLQG
jgi:hypothetical protein